MFTKINQSKMVNQSYLNIGKALSFHGVNEWNEIKWNAT